MSGETIKWFLLLKILIALSTSLAFGLDDEIVRGNLIE